jgi:hypothetical protein
MPNLPSSTQTRYYPTETDLSTPEKARAALQQVMKQHYELADAHAALQTAHAQTLDMVQKLASTPPPNGPTNTRFLGLSVTPVDPTTLADGATLRWNKSSGQFKFV